VKIVAFCCWPVVLVFGRLGFCFDGYFWSLETHGFFKVFRLLAD
jgi:hypothetical protein